MTWKHPNKKLHEPCLIREHCNGTSVKHSGRVLGKGPEIHHRSDMQPFDIHLQKIVVVSNMIRCQNRWNGDPHVLDLWCVTQEALWRYQIIFEDTVLGNITTFFLQPFTWRRNLFDSYLSKGTPKKDKTKKLILAFRVDLHQSQLVFGSLRSSVSKRKSRLLWEIIDDAQCFWWSTTESFGRPLLLKARSNFDCDETSKVHRFHLAVCEPLSFLEQLSQCNFVPVGIPDLEITISRYLMIHNVSIDRLYRLSPLHACRIGEAEHPGPEQIPFKIALINPTAVYNKQDEIEQLQCHAYALSENSATHSVQVEMDQKFRSLGIKSVWTPPVAPHTACTYDTAKRGQASGVSVHSHYPITPMTMSLDESVDHTRIVSSVIHVGPWHINIIVLYGVPSCNSRAKETTDKLLYQAGLHAAKVRLPALIIGDFNHPPHSLRSMGALMAQGYQTTSEIYCTMYGGCMPPTCREKTCNDQMIVHPELIPFLEAIQVDKSKLFSDHDPVVAGFQLPGAIPMQTCIKHPTTWMTFDPSSDYAAIAFGYFAKQKGLPIAADDEMNATNLDQALIQWTKVAEKSIDWAIRMQHIEDPEKYPATHLPKQARGRAKENKISKKPVVTWIKTACHGQYTPEHSATSILLKQKVRQIRRLQSLYYRLVKLSHLENGFQEHHLQVQKEWKAILLAPGYKPTFARWCADIPEIGWCPLTVPNTDFLHLIQQFAKMECDQLATKVASHAKKVAKFDNLYASAQTVYARTAKQVKKASPDVIQEIRETLTIPAQVISNMAGLVTLQVENTCRLQAHLPIKFAGQEATVNDISTDTVDVYFQDADQELPCLGNITQEQCHTTCEVMSAKLDEFWGQYWCRDTNQDFNLPNTANDTWTNFQRWLDNTPELAQAKVQLDDHKEWENALKKMNPKTARGIDSWTVDELRSLPTNAIKSLSQIFHRFQGSPFPERWLVALTIPLGKEFHAHSPSKTRPITVLSLLYRWWSKVVTSQVLRHWSTQIPGYITGFIPGRSPQNEMIKIQHQFEISHFDFENGAVQWQGITLDLVKCFNLIPREPARRALAKAGVPESLIQVWFQSLRKLVRFWKFKDVVVESGLTTTGTPEGDTFSVLCCVAISRIWAHHLQLQQAIPSCYADNWSWRCQQLAQNLAALETTKDFTNDCRLKIDWQKTWAWITYHINKAAWKAAMKRSLPDDATIHVVMSARELGYTMHYNKTQSRKTQKQRHQEALDQVLKIRRMPISLQLKAQLLTDACLSKALCQTETYHVGQPWFRELRAAMSRTLVPDRKITNPYLAVMLLSKYTKDPELYYVQQCIRSIRKFLLTADVDERNNFLRIAAKHNLKHMQIHGPAGTLAMCFLKLGWKITANGVIHTDSMLSLDILQSPLDSIMKCTMHSWMKNISQIYLSRQDLRNLPVIDRTNTVKIFMKMPQSQQGVIAKFLTGSFMEAKQREHVREAPVMCEICNREEDTMHHRLLHCTHTEYVRQDFPLLMQFLEEYNPCHLHLPVVYQDDLYDFNTWFFHQDWEQEVSQQVRQLIRTENNSGIRSNVYSDGSCRNPTQPTFRRASFALIFHPKVNQLQCEHLIREFHNNQEVPPSFLVFATGPCSNFQSIPRAELQAAMILLQQDLETTLHTDSQYVVDICSKLGYILDLAQMQSWANFDILRTMWHHLQRGHTRIEKIKAHAITKEDPLNYTTLHKIGNHAADVAAKQALAHLDKTSPIHENWKEQAQLQAMVEQQMQFRYQIQLARAKCMQQQETTNHPQTVSSYRSNLDKLFTLSIDNGFSYTFDDSDFDKLPNSLWGTTLSYRLLTWLNLLVWPTTPAEKGSIGITWYELAVNFQTVMQCGLVVNTGTTGKRFLPKQLAMQSHEFAYSKQVYSFERAITNLSTLLGKEIIPRQRQLSSSLRLLGASHGKQGLTIRPQLPRQKETLQSIKDLFDRHRGATPDEAPAIPSLPPHTVFEEHPSDTQDKNDWTVRIQKYNKSRKRR